MANPIVVRRVRSETEMAAWFEARREIFGDLESSPHDEHDHDPIPGLDGTTRYYSAFTTGDAGEELEHVGIVRMMVGTAKQVPSAKIVLPVDWITEGLYGEPSRFGVIRRLQRSRQSWRIILALVGGVMIDALSPDDPNEPVIDNLVHTLREALWKPLSGFYPFHPGPDLIYYPPDAGGPATEEPIIWAQSNPAEVVAASRLSIRSASKVPFDPTRCCADPMAQFGP